MFLMCSHNVSNMMEMMEITYVHSRGPSPELPHTAIISYSPTTYTRLYINLGVMSLFFNGGISQNKAKSLEFHTWKVVQTYTTNTTSSFIEFLAV